MKSEEGAAEPNSKRASASERLLTAADTLFYAQGIRAVGVDQIVRTADVAKISMYRAFPSKDDLIVAYLANRDVAFWNMWDAATATADGAEQELLAAIAFLREAILHPDYRGCPFASFAAEYPDRGHAGRRVVEASKAELRQRLLELCTRIRARDSAHLADGLFLLIEGAFSAGLTTATGRFAVGEALGWSTGALLAGQRTPP